MRIVTFLILSLFVGAYLAHDYDYKRDRFDLFLEYLEVQGIAFEDDAAFEKNFKVFSANVDRIIDLNAKHNPRTRFGLNKFALLTEEEFNSKYLGAKNPWIPSESDPIFKFSQEELAGIPDSVDWRTANPPVVTPVKDQGACGSCFSFSATGNMEGAWALSGRPLTSLSEQQVVDCDRLCINGTCDDGCNGGLMATVFQYVINNNGIDTEDSYPYQGVDGNCQFNSKTVGATIQGWTFIASQADQMAAWVAKKGPMSVAVDANLWQFYEGGVWYFPCGTSLDHGVLIVGYGTETDIFGQQMPYWTVKNSWSEGWGDNGYIYIERGDDRCGIASYPVSSIVKSAP